MDRVEIVLGQEVEGTEDLVILKLETLGSLKVSDICVVGRSLGKLLGTSLSFGELLLTVGILSRGHTRSAARATVVVVRGVRVRLHGSGIVRSAVVEV